MFKVHDIVSMHSSRIVLGHNLQALFYFLVILMCLVARWVWSAYIQLIFNKITKQKAQWLNWCGDNPSENPPLRKLPPVPSLFWKTGGKYCKEWKLSEMYSSQKKRKVRKYAGHDSIAFPLMAPRTCGDFRKEKKKKEKKLISGCS